MVGAVIAGFITFIVTAALTSEGAHFPQGQWTAALIAAVWVGLPIYKHDQIEVYNKLRPVPMRYKISWQNAFAKIREILSRASYKMGNRWNVTTADTQQRHIHAILTFTEDEFTGFDGTSPENIRRKTQRVQREVELDIHFQDAEGDAIVQTDFNVTVEGLNLQAADFVIEDVKTAISRELGPGTPVGNPAQFTWEAPPWWLLITTALLLMGLMGDASKAVFGQ
jgi:hypothetical protein